MPSNFDLLVQELAGEGAWPEDGVEEMTLPFAKAARAATLAQTARGIRSVTDALDRNNEHMAGMRAEMRREVLARARARITGHYALLKAMAASGEITAAQAIATEQKLHGMSSTLNRMEKGEVASDLADGDMHGDAGSLPPEMSAKSFRPKLMQAMKAGVVSPTEATLCEAHLLRGSKPPQDVLNRILAF